MKALNLSLSLVLLSSFAIAGTPVKTSQSVKQKQNEANKLLKVLKSNKKSSLSCTTEDGKYSFSIKQGLNEEDNSGIVIESKSYSYGTDEIQEIYLGRSLILTWGEESNYTAVVQYMDSTDGLQNKDRTSSGYIILNDDQALTPIECSLK